ncbi:MAG: hypothetical protein MJ058_04095 [Akkermansia sp.]|nr:hypothetical protein [Akkermansia sp.]
MDETTAMAGAVSQEASAFSSAVSRDSAPGIDVAPVPVEPESQISVTPPAESFVDPQGQPMPDPSATIGTGAVRSEIARMPSMRERELAGMTEWTRRNMALTETVRACLETGVASEQASCLSQSTGIPLPEVSRNLEQLRQATEAFDASSAFDSDDFRRRYPYEARLILERPEMVDVAIRKAGFFDVLANPGAILRAIGKAKAMKAEEVGGKARNVPVGQLDFDTVMDLADQEMKAKGEDVFSLAFQTVPKTAAQDGDTLSRTWKVGRLQDEDSDLGQQAAAAIMSGRVDEYEYIRYLHLKNNAEQEKLRKPVDGLSAEGVLQNALTSVPGSAGVMADGAAGAAIGAAFGAFLSPAGAAAGAKVGGAIGSTIATFSSSRQQQLGGNVWDYVDLKTDDGRQVDPRFAVLAARQGAIFGAAIETAENALDLLTLGGAGVEGRVASDLVRRNALDSVMAGAARNAASEAAEEATQTMGSAWFAQRERIYAADGEDQSFDYRKMWNDVADSMLAAGVMGGAFGAGMGAVPAMSRAIRSSGFLKFARRNAAEQTALSDAAKRQVLADQMAEMDPVTRSVIATEATRQAASDDGSPLHTVEVSPDRIVQFFMDDGLNAEEQLSRAMGDGFAAAVMNGLESGTEVSFSLTRFSQDFAALKNTKGQTLAQYVAPDAHAPGIPSRSDVEAAHADDGAFSQAIRAAVDGGLTEKQRGTLLKQTAADAGIVGVEFVDEARELADQAAARLYDEAVSSGISEDIAEAGVSAAVQSALAMTLKTGTMDFIGALATETSISGASVAYIGELAEANGVAPAKAEAPVEETRAEAQVVTQEAPVSQEAVSQEAPAQEEATVQEEPVSQEAPAQEVGVSEMETATPQESAPEAQAAPAQEEAQDPVAKAREAAEWMDSSAHLLVVGGYGIGTAMSATKDAFRVHMSRIDALKQSLSGLDHAMRNRAEVQRIGSLLDRFRKLIEDGKYPVAGYYYQNSIRPRLDLLLAEPGTVGAEINALQDDATRAYDEDSWDGKNWPSPAMKAVMKRGYAMARRLRGQAKTKTGVVEQDLYELSKAVTALELMAKKNINYYDALLKVDYSLRDSDMADEMSWDRSDSRIAADDTKMVKKVLKHADKDAKEVTLQDVAEATEKAMQEQNAPVTASDLVDEDGKEVLFSGTRGATVFPGSGDAPAYKRKKKKPDSAKKQERKETTTTVPPGALKEYYGILLSPDATASTIVHESAHIMLDVMRRVAHEKSRRTTPAFVAGVNAVEQFLGLEADAVPTREQQEKFAAQMELYLAEGESEAGEGVAPVLSWTKEQFRASVQKLENEGAVLSDEASAFFSSIFDADDVVQEAEGLAVSEMMSSTLAMADPSEVDDLMKRMLQGVDSVKRDAVVAQLHKDLAKERSLAHDLKNLTMADQEMMDLEKARVLKEMSYDERALYTGARLRKAMLDGVDEFGNAVGEWRLDRNEAKQAFGGRIPRRLALMTVEKGGLRYWDVLQMFPGMADAFASAREMFDAVASAPNSLDDEVAKRARQAVRDRCREKVAKLERRVRELTFSPEMANRIFDDLLKLGTSPHLRKDLEEASAAYVVSRSYAKVHKSWGPWTTSMKRAQREVIKALRPSKDGVHGMDRGRAAYWQQSVAYAYGVLDAIRQADQAYRRAVKSLRSWADDDTAKAVGRASLDLQGLWLDAMETFGFRRPPEDESQIAQRPRDRDAAMSALAAARAGAELGVPFIGETAAGYDRFMELVKSGASFVDLTVGDQAFALQFLREIHAAAMGQVIEIEGLGRMDAKEFAEKAAGMLPGRDRPAYMDSALKGIRRRLDDGVLKFIGARLDALALLDRMGDVGNAIFDELNRGEGMKTDMTESIKAKLEDIFSRSSPALQRIREQVEGAPGELPEGVVGGLTRQNMLVMALNTGNEGNFSRLVNGFGGEEKGWTPESVMAWLDARMEKSDWDFVQQVWDLMDQELYPRVAQTYLEVEALPMRKVRAVSVETRHGAYRGGYYPIHYDPDSSVGQRQEVSAADTVNAWNAATAQGFTKNRADRPQMPRLSLEWASLFPAISQQIQYATHEKAARNVSRLLNRREFSDAVTRKFGRDYMKLARDMVKTYASGPENSISLGGMFNWVSNMVTQSVLGWSFPAAIGDLARPFMAAGMGEVSGMSALRAAMNPRESIELARNLSAEFRTLTSRTTARFLSQDFVEADAGVTAFGKDAVSDPTAAYDAASAAFRRYRKRIETLNFYLMEKVTQFTAATIWGAALHDAMDAGLQEAEAVKRADRAIQKLMPNTTEWRKSEIQRSAWYRIATVFAGEGLKTLSIMAHTHPEKLLEDAKGGDLQKLARRVAAVSSVLMLYPLLSALIMGRGRDEDEGWAFWGVRTSLQGVAGFDPIFGAGIWAGIEVALSGRNQIATGPLAIHYGRLSRDMNALFEVKGPSTPAEKAFAIVDAIGPTASLPTNEIQKVAKPLVGVNGVDDDEDVLDFIESVLYGRSSRRGWNAFRLLETDAKKARTEARRKADRRDRGRRNANARRNRRQ